MEDGTCKSTGVTQEYTVCFFVKSKKKGKVSSCKYGRSETKMATKKTIDRQHLKKSNKLRLDIMNLKTKKI